MKRRVKNLIVGLACALTCGLATAAVGCTSASDWLEQQRCEHVWNGGKVTEKATCTEEGEKLYECTKCGKEKKEDLEKLPHTEHTVEAKAATCDEKGMTDYVECSVCNAILVAGKELPALGHTEIELPGIEATCTTKGKTEGKYCTRCKEYTVEQTELPALGHKLVDIEAVEATCSAAGSTRGIKCERCETIYTQPQVIPSLGHTIVNGVCTTCGTVTDETAFFAQTASMKETQIDANHVTTAGFYRVYFSENTDGIYQINDQGFKVVSKSGCSMATLGVSGAINPANVWTKEEETFAMAVYESALGDGAQYIELDGSKYILIQDNLEQGYLTIYYTGTTWTETSEDGSVTVTFSANAAAWLSETKCTKVTRLS
ncbi:MAG: hypothetical protein IJB97_00630 [Clostridia bacterium]|nr:hypothetical protein [Clostridia bacterium]